MSIGFWQIVLILLIVLIVFGSGKLPKVMEDLAKGIKSFREGMNLEDTSSSESSKSLGAQKKIKKTPAKHKKAPQKKSLKPPL